MILREIASLIRAEVLTGEELLDTLDIECAYGADLMSDVLLVDADDMLLVTSLASDQALRTAQIVGAMGVVVANGKPLPSTMVDVARSLGIPLATSPLSKYDCCVRIHKARMAEKQCGAGA